LKQIRAERWHSDYDDVQGLSIYNVALTISWANRATTVRQLFEKDVDVKGKTHALEFPALGRGFSSMAV
jgi:hypothetical protein